MRLFCYLYNRKLSNYHIDYYVWPMSKEVKKLIPKNNIFLKDKKKNWDYSWRISDKQRNNSKK